MKLFSTASAVVALFSFLPADAFGQQNYQPAKVTTLAGDTLRGFINYRGWSRNPRVVLFKTDLQASEQRFRPLDIKSFSVNSERYAGAKVNIEDSRQDLANLSTTAAPSFRADTVFLRALVSGPKELYEYKTPNSQVFFYIATGSGYDLLVYKRYKAPGEGAAIVQNNNTYRDQLAGYLADCPALTPKLGTSSYTASSLQRIMATYYTCTNRAPVFRMQSKVRHQFSVLAGVAQSTLSFSNTTNSQYPLLDSYTQLRPTGGISYAVSLPGSLNRLYIVNDLIFNSFSGSSTREENSPTASTYRSTTSVLELTYLKLHSMLRYAQPLGVGTVFINAGITNGYAVQVKSEKSVREKFYSSDRSSTAPLFTDFRRYEQGLVGGVGASYKRLSAEGRYEYSNGFFNYNEFNSTFKRYSLLIGFRLH